MKTLTKLALVSALAMSSSAFALQTLGDEELSQATGQDGITIRLEGNIGDSATKLVVHDRGGFQDLTTPAFTRANAGLAASTGTANATLGTLNNSDGAIVLDGFNINLGPSGAIVVNVDADANGTTPLLNVNIGLPATLTVNTGTIKVAKSGGINAAAAAQFTNAVDILDNVAIVLKSAKLNVQLGTAAQGAFIKLNSDLTNGLTISNLNIFQPGGAPAISGHPITTTGTAAAKAAIRMGSLNIKDSAWDGTANSASDKWTLAANINVADDGLIIQGLDTTNVDVRITDLKLGNAAQATLGNVAVLGLKLPSAVIVSGH